MIPAIGNTSVRVGEEAPDFTLVDNDGNQFNLMSKRGKTVVLFWMGYSWGSCKAEAPLFEANIHRIYKSPNVEFIGLDVYDGTRSIVLSQFVIPTGITFPILLNASSIGFFYGMGTSNFMIIDENGIITYLQRFYNENALKQSLDTLTNANRNPNVSQPTEFKLEQNFPNPFNPSTSIYYELKINEPSLVSLTVYDILGKEVKTLVNETQPSGFYKINWNGTNNQNTTVPAGVYLYELRSNGFVETKRMLLLK
jgi:peroxiredoxin